MTPFHILNAVDGGRPAQFDQVSFGVFPAMAFAASANSVTALGSITAGSGFSSLPTLTPSGGTGSGLKAKATALKAVTATVVSGGASGFAQNDTITLSNGVVLTVSTVSSGVVTAATVTTPGSFTSVDPTAVLSQVSKTGSGVGTTTWTLSYGLASAAIVNSGNYSGAPSMTVSGGGGTGASIAAATLGGNGAEITVEAPAVLNGEVASPYAVFAQASVPAFVRTRLKTSRGFSIGLTPITASATLAAGTVDAILIG